MVTLCPVIKFHLGEGFGWSFIAEGESHGNAPGEIIIMGVLWLRNMFWFGEVHYSRALTASIRLNKPSSDVGGPTTTDRTGRGNTGGWHPMRCWNAVSAVLPNCYKVCFGTRKIFQPHHVPLLIDTLLSHCHQWQQECPWTQGGDPEDQQLG